MDKIEKYRQIVFKIVDDYAKIRYANVDAANSLLIDRENDRYAVVTMGWDGYKRIHACPIHFDIVDGKIIVQIDHTDYGIANDLLEAGIPKSDIVLGYYPAERGAELGFAVLEAAQAPNS